MFDFIAIDFETATENNDSACSIGLVFVKDLEIVDKQYYLINPPNNLFDKENIEIHNITPAMVENELRFNELWEKIKSYFTKDNLIIAHNSHFDMSVLKCCLQTYQLEIPDFYYSNSVPITYIRHSGAGHSLKDRADYFGIEINNHHNALDDALTCAKIVLESKKKFRFKTFDTFIRNRNIEKLSFLELEPQIKFPKKGNKISKFLKNNINIKDIAVTVDNINDNHIFYNKNFVFTGTLQNISREDAMQNTVNLGGIIKRGVTSKTDYLVIGVQDLSVVGEDGLSSKQRKAFELIESGSCLKILDETQFLNLLKQ